MGQTWDNLSITARCGTRRTAIALVVEWLADLIWDVWLAAFIIVPVGAGLFAVVNSLGETGHVMQAWAAIAWTMALGICVITIALGTRPQALES